MGRSNSDDNVTPIRPTAPPTSPALGAAAGGTPDTTAVEEDAGSGAERVLLATLATLVAKELQVAAREAALAAQAPDPHRDLAKDSPHGIVVHYCGEVVFANSSACAFVGASDPSEVVGRPITDFVAPDSRAALTERIDSLKEPGAHTKPAEAVLLMLDGHSTLEVESTSVLTVWNGQRAYQVILRDLTVQKQAAAALDYQATTILRASDAIVATSSDGLVTSWNPAAREMYGRTEADVIGRPVSEAVGALLDPQAIIDAGGTQEDALHHDAAGNRLAVRVSAADMPDGFVLLCADETARRKAEQHFTTVVESLNEGVIVVGPTGHIDVANPAAHRIVGARDGTLVGMHSDDIRLFDEAGNEIPQNDFPSAQITRSGKAGSRVVRVRRRDGHDRWIAITSVPIGPAGRGSSVLTSFTDITEDRADQVRLAFDATHDPLTKLANRGPVLSHITSALAKPGATVTVLFIDLDNFKMVNDSLGHPTGDQVLKIAASRLRTEIAGGIVGRHGGDKFVMVTTTCATQAAVRALGDHVRQHLTSPMTVNGRGLTVSTNIGAVMAASGDTRSAAQLIADSELAMYKAKATRRGQVVLYDEALREPIVRRGRLEDDLVEAIRDAATAMPIVYQPIVNLRTGVTVAAEATPHWVHTKYGTISPAEVLAVADADAEWRYAIGAHVIQTALRESAQWRVGHGVHLNVNVNLSIRQLGDTRLRQVMERALEASSTTPAQVCVEVTEDALLESAEILTALREEGFQVAVDDFGTRRSSLAVLQRLSLTAIKIDGSFVAELGTSPNAEHVVAGMVGMVHAVGMVVVAEGVDTAEQLEILRTMGCDYAQGDFIARPGPAADLVPHYDHISQ